MASQDHSSASSQTRFGTRPHRVYRFGSFELDAEAKVLFKNGRPVRLAVKSVETLLVLVENAERVLTKEEMSAAIWPDRVVDDVNLPQHISLLRKALATNGDGEGYIVTFVGRGYQFTVPVEVASNEHVSPVRKRFPGRVPRLPGLRWIWLLGAVAAAVLLAGLLTLTSRTTSQAAEELPARRPLLRLPGGKSHPVISRDGAKVAFVWDRGEEQPTCIFVHETGTTAPRAVQESCGEPSSPAWSPESDRLALLRHRPQVTELVTVAEGGGPVRVIARLFPVRRPLTNRLLDWSPDGETLVVSDKLSADEPFSLFLITIANGDRRRLTDASGPGNPIGDVEPRFSPDGTQVAYVHSLSHQWSDVMLVSLESGKARPLSTRHQEIGSVDWAPGAEEVVFSARMETDYRLWRVSRSSASPAIRPDPAGLFGDHPLHFSIFSGGEALVYIEWGIDLNIWRLTLPQRPGDGALWERWIASTGEDSAPQYSPDGRKIAFVSDRFGDPQVWVANADASGARQLTSGDMRPHLARWSPDSDSIVFNGHDRSTYTVRVSGGQPRRVMVHPRISLAIFSPSGQYLMGTVPIDGKPSLIRAPIEGGASEPLTRKGGFFAVVSPDGQDIFYTKNRMSTKLWRMRVAGRREELLLDGLVSGQFGYWACGGNSLLYLGLGRAEGTYAVYRLDLATGRTEWLAPVPGQLPPLGVSFSSASPDGRYLLVTRPEFDTNDLVEVHPYR